MSDGNVWHFFCSIKSVRSQHRVILNEVKNL